MQNSNHSEIVVIHGSSIVGNIIKFPFRLTGMAINVVSTTALIGAILTVSGVIGVVSKTIRTTKTTTYKIEKE